MATTVFAISQQNFDAIASANNEWLEMFEHVETARVVDMHRFHGRIDHVEVKKKRITFYDIGCNGHGRDLVIMRDTERVFDDYPVILKR